LLSVSSVTALPHLCFVNHFSSHLIHVCRASSTSSQLIRLTLAGRTATSIGSVSKRLNDIHAYYKSSSGMGMSDCFVLPACHSVCVSCRNEGTSQTSTLENCSSVPTLNLTLIMRLVMWDRCRDVLKKKRKKERKKFSAQKSCKVNLSRYNCNY